jgi:hypothetical protein
VPEYDIYLSVQGTSRFRLEAGSLEEAQELAEEMLEAGTWTPDKEDHEYEFVHALEVTP